MDENVQQICQKACIEYCEDGFVSESTYKSFMSVHDKVSYPDQEQINAFMRNFIEQYIKDRNLPWRSNRCLYGEVYGLGIITCIDAIPKEGWIGPFHFETIKSED